MTANVLIVYGCAVLTIVVLCLFARQNQKSGWKRHRAGNLAEALQDFYMDLGISTEEQSLAGQWKPLDAEETIDFSAQMLRMRAALGSSMPVTQDSPVTERALAAR